MLFRSSINANIWLDYRQSGGSFFYPYYRNIGGNYYFAGGIIRLKNNYPGSVNIYRTFCHEAFIHGLGMDGHSDDPNYISYGQNLQAFDFQQEEIEAIKNHVLQYSGFITGPYYLNKFIEE